MKILYIIIGGLALSLGIIGIVLPVLPTTPFFLLAACCFAKGSNRLHDRFVKSKLYQKHLESFVKERAMLLRTKVVILGFASSMLLLAMVFMEAWYLRIFLLCLMIFKYYYFIVRIKTIKVASTI